MLALLLLVSASSEPVIEPTSEPSDDVFAILSEQEEVFTGARGLLRVRESGSNVWVIDRATIEAMATTSLADVLRLIPGIYVREISASFTETHTRIPVLVPDNRTLFLVDGRSLQFENFGYTDKMGVELWDVERIEVIMGPASTLYGSNALAGVVNIVTKAALQGEPGASSTVVLRGGLATGSAGDPGEPRSNRWQPLGRAFVDASYRTQSFGFRASVGADYLPTFVSAWQLSPGPASPSPHGRVNAAIDIEQRVNGWKLRQRAAVQLHNSYYVINEPSAIRFQDYSLTLHASRDGLASADDQLSFIVWSRLVAIDYTMFAQDLAPASLNSQQGTTEIFAQYKTPKFLLNNQMNLGTQIRFSYVGQEGVAEINRFAHVYGLFAEDTWRPIDRLVLTAGIRLETSESRSLRAFSRFNVAGRGSVVWLINDHHALRAEAASAFRNPNIFESFMDYVDSNGTERFAGNPDLRAEQVLQISLGYNGAIDWFKIRSELLVFKPSDLIVPETALGEPTTEGIRFANLPLNLWIPVASLRLEADIKKLAKVWAYYHFVPLKPEHLAGLGAQLELGRVTASTQLYFVDSYYNFGADPADPGTSENAARLVWNAQVSVALDQRFRLVLAGTNLVDARFYRYPATQHVARDYSVGERIGQRLWLELRAAL